MTTKKAEEELFYIQAMMNSKTALDNSGVIADITYNYQLATAKRYKSLFNAYVDAGFSEEAAMDILKMNIQSDLRKLEYPSMAESILKGFFKPKGEDGK